MSLRPGTRLGSYEITALIGEGGMSEVYRARDTKPGRDVALKVLPDLFADDPERLARFQREARVLASLNHPNIASIYGLEESGDRRALVLELVEGPTLAERIAQGAIPVDEALPIARQMAEALEAAHEAGGIHRDLKPANVKVKADGMVKVLGNRQKTAQSLRCHWHDDLLRWSGGDHVLAKRWQLEGFQFNAYNQRLNQTTLAGHLSSGCKCGGGPV